MSIHNAAVLEDNWFVVMQIDATTWLGVWNGECWVGGTAEPKRRVNLDFPVGLLPILEHPRDQVFADIAAREKEWSLADGTLMRMIPWDGLVRCVVSMGSNYWAELLLDWCEGQPLTPTEMEVFTQLSHAEWASQRVRHRAGKRVHQERSDS